MSKGNIRHCEYCDFSEDGDIDNPCPGISIDYEAAARTRQNQQNSVDVLRLRHSLDGMNEPWHPLWVNVPKDEQAALIETMLPIVDAALGGQDETL